ncbi:hypothetical protein [Peribacillus frigoritolerans]|uniref:hypothetical protein n=1 Tax=Peribacillus frigoritolerans TaxID=450367 RepID=UPI00341EA419
MFETGFGGAKTFKEAHSYSLNILSSNYVKHKSDTQAHLFKKQINENEYFMFGWFKIGKSMFADITYINEGFQPLVQAFAIDNYANKLIFDCLEKEETEPSEL